MTTLDTATSHLDMSWDGMYIMWTVIESNLGIICACLATLRQLLTVFLRGILRIFPTFSADEGSVPSKRGEVKDLSSLIILTDSALAGRQRNPPINAAKWEDCGNHSTAQHSPSNERNIVRTMQIVVKYDINDKHTRDSLAQLGFACKGV